MESSADNPALGFGLHFADLYSRQGLIALDRAFIDALGEASMELRNLLVNARANPQALTAKEESQLLIDLAPHVEDFIVKLFGIEHEMCALAKSHHALAPLYACKRLFVQRRAAKAYKEEEVKAFDYTALKRKLDDLLGGVWDELTYSRHVLAWLEAEAIHQEQLTLAAQYAAWALYSEEGRHIHKAGVLFKLPKKLDPQHLIPMETELRDGVTMLRLPQNHLRHREGFALTDPGGSLVKALDEAHYCIYCHNQDKDFCSKGMKEKDGIFKKNALGITLAGCPLEEKISEMNLLKSNGVPLGALAVAIVDNPMVAGTGHRICNDCMKSCIYQKQEPVNIPLQETRTLKDILDLPWGFEIYSLLTRWNPLNLARPLPRPETDKKVLVVGLGPAGYTLAHHLMNDGHTVVAVDGLKIEPLPPELCGVSQDGSHTAFKPIQDVKTLYESLNTRIMAGFGGVAEYGITVRWDKNYLTLIRLLLERRAQFAMFGGVRFGGTITYELAWELGFDHIALCMGAGRPTVLDIPNGLARGVRAASDFLMALQLTGAAKTDSIANLQIRLPVVVIGGGLTAIDTATESLAYYPVQVEKFLQRYDILAAEYGEAHLRSTWSPEDTEIAKEFINHGRAIRAERAQAQKEGREADILSLLDGWGGVKLVYRRRLIDAPSYRLNHEEVEKALEEGIFIAEQYEPKAVEVDAYGHARAIRFHLTDIGSDGDQVEQEVILPARSILVAAGTSPNTVLSREDATHFMLDGKFFRALDESGNPVKPQQVSKPEAVHILMALEQDGRAVSFFGDLHPSFAGNVVKAMGSAKQGYPVVSRILEKKNSAFSVQRSEFLKRIYQALSARVHEVRRLTPTIVEVVVQAPLAAQQFQPGQFYRLQNYEAYALKVASDSRLVASKKETSSLVTSHQPLTTTLTMEGLAMTGAWVDKQNGLLSTIVLEMGGSSDLCAYLQPGEPVILMGPTGTPTEIPANETILLAGGGLGNAVLFSIGKAMREAGCKVLYFAGYKKAADRYKVEEIEAAADSVVWACDELAFIPNRPQDKTFHGNIVQAIKAYGEGKMREDIIPLSSVDRIIAIGSDRMMAALALARHNELKPLLNPRHVAIGSINSPMQCMMKEICAQCLQKHIDPQTGKEHYVFSCFNQDQSLDTVSFPDLMQRLAQNSLQEKITARWIDHCLRILNLRKAAA